MKGMIIAMSLVMGSADWALAGEPADTKPSAATVLSGNVGTPGQKDMPPRIDPLPGPNVPLSPKERHGVRYGKEWANNRDVPARGEDGSIVFVFGSTLPTVVCAPLYVCDLALQTGESVNDLNVGDSVRWQITPATQGSGDRLTTHVMIKPTDVGLLTNLVITTDRRAYTIKLVSQRTEWMPRVSFFYPEDVRSEWGAYRTRQEASREKAASAAPKARLVSISLMRFPATAPPGDRCGSMRAGPRPTSSFPRASPMAICRRWLRWAMMAGSLLSHRSNSSITATFKGDSRSTRCSTAPP